LLQVLAFTECIKPILLMGEPEGMAELMNSDTLDGVLLHADARLAPILEFNIQHHSIVPAIQSSS
jgi:hypothetical protein